VFFDEPELHLHPELSYRLLQALQEIGKNNQFIFATHSPDIISASLDRSVIFVSSPELDMNQQPINQALPVTEGDSTNRALQLLGHSIGIISLGRRIVLIEGTQASVDKQTYGSILENAYPSLVLVPSGGRHVIESFEAVYESVLSKTIWGVEFFMLCDGDSSPPDCELTNEAVSRGRLALLPKYHLENYFLDETVWVNALTPLDASDDWTRDIGQLRAKMREIALGYVSYAVALRVAGTLRYSFGNIDVMPSACHGKSLDELCSLFVASAKRERDRLDGALNEALVVNLLTETHRVLQDSLERPDDDTWKTTVPGRPVLNTLAGTMGLKPARAKRLYLRAASEVVEGNPFSEVQNIFKHFAELETRAARSADA
jgi:hypothetical protein